MRAKIVLHCPAAFRVLALRSAHRVGFARLWPADAAVRMRLVGPAVTGGAHQ